MTKKNKNIVSKSDTKKQEPQSFKLQEINPEFLTDCCICGTPIQPQRGRKIVWYEGNNAEPVMSGRCCDWCNDTKVLPTRLWGKDWEKNASSGVVDMWYRYHHQEQAFKEARNKANEMACQFEIPDHRIWDFQDWWINHHEPPNQHDFHAHRLLDKQYERTISARNKDH